MVYHSSEIQYVTLAKRYSGEDGSLLKQRDELYRQARKAHPERWRGKTRNWEPEGPALLNPEREKQAA